MWCQLQSLCLCSFHSVWFLINFNQLFSSRVLSRVMEIFGSISVWVSSLSAHSKAGSGWALWGLWVRGCPLFSGGLLGAPTPSLTWGEGCLPSDSAWWPAGGSFVSSALSGLGLLDNGAASRLRGGGLPQCPPARRHCKREKWGWSRHFLCPAERWMEVHLREPGGLGGKSSMCKMAGF